jgi:hypothetical protein
MEPHGPPLRVRITGRLDVHATDETSVTVAGAEVASKLVRDWLLRLEGAPAIGDPGGRSLRAVAPPPTRHRRRKETT